MDRDALLAAALGAAVLTGCTAPRRVPSPSPTPPPVDPDVAVLRSWAALERRAVATYDVAVRTAPALAPLRANHLARAAAVEALLATRGATPSPATPASRAPDPSSAERGLVAAILASLPRVADPDVAVLGAELAAGARQHATLLPLVPRPRR
ncbi:MAG: hypothetical protein QOE45_2044 [Frankiaceae bacterium]|nr:hypothetical protein [Frankiaceae bacterium]